MTVRHHTLQAAVLDGAQVLEGPLPEVVSMAPIIEGVPVAHEKTVLNGADGFFAIWACGAGVFPRVKDKRGSFMYILSGDATIVDQDGTSHELTADTVLVLPFGWAGTWHIRETIRKVYLHTTPVPPLPAAVVPSAFSPADEVRSDADAMIFDGPDGRCDLRSREPGRYRQEPDPHGFFCYLLAGDGSLAGDDGTRHDFGPGSVIALPSGWSGGWDIRHRLRGFRVRSTPAPPA